MTQRRCITVLDFFYEKAKMVEKLSSAFEILGLDTEAMFCQGVHNSMWNEDHETFNEEEEIS